MKFLIILLLSTTGIEEVKLKTDNCEKVANNWTDINTLYYPVVNGDPKLQGNYTKDGKLLLGWICNKIFH